MDFELCNLINMTNSNITQSTRYQSESNPINLSLTQ